MAGCSGLAVVSVISSSGCSVVSTPACSVVGWWGLAVVWSPVVAGVVGLDVIGSCGLVVGTSGFEVFGVTAVAGVCVSQSVVAVVAMVAVVVKVDGCCGFDEVDDCGSVTVEVVAGGPSVETGLKIVGAGIVGLARSVTTYHNQVSCISFQL